MDFTNPIIPITAFVALVLFIIREVLEMIRRFSSQRRKTKAAKKLLSIETELNEWSKNSLYETLQDIQERGQIYFPLVEGWMARPEG